MGFLKLKGQIRKFKFIGIIKQNELPNLTEALFLFFRYEFNDIPWTASNDVTEFFYCKKGDIVSFSDGIQSFGIDTGF